MKKSGGFTLIELLVVIAIVALLSALAVYALNNARTKARDSKRVADLNQITKAFELYYNDKGYYPPGVGTSTPFILGDSTHACLGANGFQASGSCTAPVYIAKIPPDPLPNGKYSYAAAALTPQSYEVTTTLEGITGDLSGVIQITPEKGVVQISSTGGGGGSGGGTDCSATTVCGTSCDYSGESYGTVAIGSQCWMKKNLNVGTMLTVDGTFPTDNGVVEKWCFNMNPTNCLNTGGLYTWAEALGFDPSCNSLGCLISNPQGICPPGWHIPSDNDFFTLETSLGMDLSSLFLVGWRGTNQGTQLKIGGTSGFDADISSGYRTYGGAWGSSAIFFITSNQFSSTQEPIRYLTNAQPAVYRGSYDKANGFSVRCLKN